MSEDNANLDANGPPPVQVEPPHSKGTPHHLESRLDPEMKEQWDKMVADKENARRNFQIRDEELRKTQQKLTQLQQEKEAANKAEMEAQGKYKELSEQSERRAKDLEEKLFKLEVQSNLDRELLQHGAVDAEVSSTFILAKYGDELRSNPAGVSSLVGRYKEDKPHLFKPSAPVVAPPKPTGQSTPVPPTGAATPPTQAKYTDKVNGKYVIPMGQAEADFDKLFGDGGKEKLF